MSIVSLSHTLRACVCEARAERKSEASPSSPPPSLSSSHSKEKTQKLQGLMQRRRFYWGRYTAFSSPSARFLDSSFHA